MIKKIPFILLVFFIISCNDKQPSKRIIEDSITNAKAIVKDTGLNDIKTPIVTLNYCNCNFNLDTTSFNYLFSLFQNKYCLGNKNAKLDSLLIKFTKEEMPNYGFMPIVGFQSDDTYSLIYDIDHSMAGTGAGVIKMSCFNFNGDLLDDTTLCNWGGTDEYVSTNEVNQISKDVVEIIRKDDSKGKEEMVSYSYAIVSSSGNIIIKPLSSYKQLSFDDLKKFNSKELLIVRNQVFAYHGYIFKDPFLKEYFNYQTWYTPKYLNVDSYLTELEIKNINTIKSFEQTLK